MGTKGRVDLVRVSEDDKIMYEILKQIIKYIFKRVSPIAYYPIDKSPMSFLSFTLPLRRDIGLQSSKSAKDL